MRISEAMMMALLVAFPFMVNPQQAIAQRTVNEDAQGAEYLIESGLGDLIGDPVRLAIGSYVLEETDIQYSSDRMLVSFYRRYESNHTMAHSLGPGWVFFYDTRIIRGIDANVEERVASFGKVSRETDASYEKSHTSHEESIADLEASIATRIRAQEAAAEAVSSARAAIEVCKKAGGFRLQEAEKMLEAALATENKVNSLEPNLAELQAARDKLVSGRSLLEQYRLTADELRVEYLKQRDAARISEVNRELDRYVCNETDPDYYQAISSNHATLITEKGVSIGYKAESAPDFTSTVRLPNGMTNFYPSGMAYKTSTVPGEKLELLASGQFLRTSDKGIRYLYDIYGRILLVIDSFGNRLSFIYAVDGGLSSLRDDYGRVTRIERRAGLITKIVDPLGRTIAYEYDMEGRLAKVTDAMGAVIRYFYDGNLLVKILKPDGSFRECFYEMVDGRKVVVRTSDEEGYSEKFRYDFGNKNTEYENKSGIVKRFFFNDRFETVKCEFADGQPVVESTGSANEPSEPQPRVSYSRDAQGNVIAVLAYADGCQERMVYDKRGRIVERTDRKGIAALCTYDIYGYPSAIDYSDETRERFVFDLVGRLLEHEGKEGVVTFCAYDADNKVVKKRIGNDTEERFIYNDRKDLVMMISGADAITRFFHDKRHLLLFKIDPDGSAYGTEYRADELPVFRRTGKATLKPGCSGALPSDWNFLWTNTTAIEYDPNGNIRN